jgi:hypothetical protein
MMTGLYWTAAVLALVWAGYTAVRLRRDRSALVVASLLCMASAAATMGIAAVWPELMWAGPAHPVIAWLLVSLGLLATWTFLGVLAAVTGQTARPLALVAVPLAAAAAGGLILAEVPRAWAVGPAPDAWSVRALASQCLGACCCPAEGRITVIAWRFSRRVRIWHIRWGMRAVAAGAAVEFALILARAAMIGSYAGGEESAGRVATAIGAAQAAAVISIVAGTTTSAWYPPLSRLARQAWLWSALWRLRPLWAALRQVVPEVTLPRPPGMRLNIRYRVDRRVIEIRDAELALRAYSPPDVPGRAETAARCAGLDAGEAVAVAEAAVIVTALAARRDGQPPRLDGTPGKATSKLPRNDLRAEAARLILVARAFRCSPVVARIAERAGRAAEPAGRLGELTVRSLSAAPCPLEAFDESAGLRSGRRQWLRLVTGLLVDQRGERLSVPFLLSAVHAPAED